AGVDGGGRSPGARPDPGVRQRPVAERLAAPRTCRANHPSRRLCAAVLGSRRGRRRRAAHPAADLDADGRADGDDDDGVRARAGGRRRLGLHLGGGGPERPAQLTMAFTSHPPPEQWDDFVDFESTSWPKKERRRYWIIPTTCLNCETAG